MGFPDQTFHLVVVDPPQLVQAGPQSWLGKKYGILSGDWQNDIRQGFSECFRVTKEDMGRLRDFVVVGHIQPGKGIQKRFAEFLEGTVTVKLPAHCGNLSDI